MGNPISWGCRIGYNRLLLFNFLDLEIQNQRRLSHCVVVQDVRVLDVLGLILFVDVVDTTIVALCKFRNSYFEIGRAVVLVAVHVGVEVLEQLWRALVGFVVVPLVLLLLLFALDHHFDEPALPLLEDGVALGGDEVAHGAGDAHFVEL